MNANCVVRFLRNQTYFRTLLFRLPCLFSFTRKGYTGLPYSLHYADHNSLTVSQTWYILVSVVVVFKMNMLYTHIHTQQREGGGGGIETQEYQLALFLSKPFKHIHSSLAKPHDESPAFQNSWRHKNGGVAQLVAFMGCGTALRHVVPIWGEAASSLREA